MGFYKLLVIQKTSSYGLLPLPYTVQLLDLTTTLEWFYSIVALISYVNIIDHDFIEKRKYVNKKNVQYPGADKSHFLAVRRNSITLLKW